MNKTTKVLQFIIATIGLVLIIWRSNPLTALGMLFIIWANNLNYAKKD
jgi:hypothetical protein